MLFFEYEFSDRPVGLREIIDVFRLQVFQYFHYNQLYASISIRDQVSPVEHRVFRYVFLGCQLSDCRSGTNLSSTYVE